MSVELRALSNPEIARRSRLAARGYKNSPASTEVKPLANFVRSFELNSNNSSHDWHVQPVVKDRYALRLSGAFQPDRRRMREAPAACPRNLWTYRGTTVFLKLLRAATPKRSAAASQEAARDTFWLPAGCTRHHGAGSESILKDPFGGLALYRSPRNLAAAGWSLRL